MPKKIPTTIVLCLILIVIAAWPSVQAWAEQSEAHHYLVHCLYLISGVLFGLQTARWAHRDAPLTHAEEAGVSS